MIFKKLLSVPETETVFARRGFSQLNEQTVAHLESIGRFFLRGYHLALSSSSLEGLVKNLNQVRLFYKGFSYEGAAMALAILDWISFFKKNRISTLLMDDCGNKHIYMLHVGIGWAYARLPVNIMKRMDRFDPVLRWLIVDGYGFHQAYFKTEKYVDRMQLPPNLKDYYFIKVFYQGIGRCLWFIECASPDKITNRIQRFPKEYQADLWSGVGLACVYAGGIQAKEIKILKLMADDLWPHLAQGAVFAAKARKRAEIITEENEIPCKINLFHVNR